MMEACSGNSCTMRGICKKFDFFRSLKNLGYNPISIVPRKLEGENCKDFEMSEFYGN